MCTRDERNWSKSDAFAIRSMAQTRAASKALRTPLAFVMTLSGYAATPADEMVTEAAPQEVMTKLPAWARPANNDDIARAAHALVALLRALDVAEPSNEAIRLGKRIRARCDNTVPVCLVPLLEDLVAKAVETTEAVS